ncbi:MAG TPA: cysteine synthase A [Firmicutes bacterium]|nr:cysteine synthase A [Bacillota bacterium]
MGRIYHGIEELTGHTPLLEMNRFTEGEKIDARLFGKLEFLNPAGSAKDRVALAMIEEAEENGTLKPGSVIIEPTSGNTGIGLAAFAAVKGYRAVIVMPDTMSVERQKLMTAHGAELVLTEGAKGMAGAIEKAEELKKEIPGSIVAGQFVNPANPKAHYVTSGPEIWDDTEGMVDVFVAGIGTGGTITGVGRYLKEMNPAVKIVGVEPADSPVLEGGQAGPHGLQGIGAGFVPDILDTSVYDEIVAITTEEAYQAARAVAVREGFLIGISSGAAVAAAVKLTEKEEMKGRNIVVFLPDSGERYLSTDLYGGQE